MTVIGRVACQNAATLVAAIIGAKVAGDAGAVVSACFLNIGIGIAMVRGR